jgi:hypothetical protein
MSPADSRGVTGLVVAAEANQPGVRPSTVTALSQV